MTKPAPDPIDRYVGRRLYQLRKDRGLTQRQVAAAVGITYQQLQKYETGVNRIGAGRLYAIAETLGVPLSLFCVGIEEGTAREPLQPDTSKAPELLGEMIPDPATRRAFVGEQRPSRKASADLSEQARPQHHR